MRTTLLSFLTALLTFMGPPATLAQDATRAQAEASAKRLAGQLRQDTAVLLKRAKLGNEIRKELWPESVRQLNPQAVQRHMDGALLVLVASDGWLHGIYIHPKDGDEPSEGSGVAYEKVADGLFWCSEKVRIRRK